MKCCDWITILDLVFGGILACMSVLAFIFGLIIFNKRLKIYTYVEDYDLKIVAFDRGNSDCFIEHIAYYVKKGKETVRSFNNKCVITINLKILSDCRVLHITIIDNYGRKYKLKYKNKNNRGYQNV